MNNLPTQVTFTRDDENVYLFVYSRNEKEKERVKTFIRESGLYKNFEKRYYSNFFVIRFEKLEESLKVLLENLAEEKIKLIKTLYKITDDHEFIKEEGKVFSKEDIKRFSLEEEISIFSFAKDEIYELEFNFILKDDLSLIVTLPLRRKDLF